MGVIVGLNGHEHTFPNATGWRVESDGMLALRETRDETQTIIASFRNWDYAILDDAE